MPVRVRGRGVCEVWVFKLPIRWFSPFPRLFLLRDSQSNPKAFVLTLCHHQKIKNFQILPVSIGSFVLVLTGFCSVSFPSLVLFTLRAG